MVDTGLMLSEFTKIRVRAVGRNDLVGQRQVLDTQHCTSVPGLLIYIVVNTCEEALLSLR